MMDNHPHLRHEESGVTPASLKRPRDPESSDEQTLFMMQIALKVLKTSDNPHSDCSSQLVNSLLQRLAKNMSQQPAPPAVSPVPLPEQTASDSCEPPPLDDFSCLFDDLDDDDIDLAALVCGELDESLESLLIDHIDAQLPVNSCAVM
jgi:hypothetical protein